MLFLLTEILDKISPTLVQLRRTTEMVKLDAPKTITIEEIKKSSACFKKLREIVDECGKELGIVFERLVNERKDETIAFIKKEVK